MTNPNDVIRDPALERLYTIAEVADHLQINARTVQRFLAGGQLKVVMFGRASRVSRTELKRFMLEGTAPKETHQAKVKLWSLSALRNGADIT